MESRSAEVLEIDDITTCAGYAYLEDRRCNTQLSSGKTEAAKTFLDHLSSCALSADDTIHEYLWALARCQLCPQRHQDQAESLVEKWKLRIFRVRTASVVQALRDFQTMENEITARLGASRLSEPQPASSHTSLRTAVLDEHRPIETHEYSPSHSLSIASSSRQRFTTVHTDDLVSSNLQTNRDGSPISFQNSDPQLGKDASLFIRLRALLSSAVKRHAQGRDDQSNHDGNPLWLQHSDPQLFKDAPLFIRLRALLSSAVKRQAKSSNEKSQLLEETHPDCPICLGRCKSKHKISRCHECLKKFHETCINQWLGQRKESCTTATCPCW